MPKYKHYVKGKYCGEFEDSNMEEAMQSVLAWHNIEVVEVDEDGLSKRQAIKKRAHGENNTTS